mmetsp:Transcript_2618/g.6275  ORF Transcript_2618/g.6275 Transcript_2618/m.6275 type:complete len:87 (-) Transcript_2618:15-275(-)
MLWNRTHRGEGHRMPRSMLAKRMAMNGRTINGFTSLGSPTSLPNELVSTNTGCAFHASPLTQGALFMQDLRMPTTPLWEFTKMFAR